MDTDEYKKYAILENILQKINQKCVALSTDETKRNNKIQQKVIDRTIQALRSKSVLFGNIYQNKFYGGSFYDGLKVGQPSEFDLDCLLCLPKIVKPTVELSDKPGYVHIVLTDFKALENQAAEIPKYVGLDKLLDGNQLSAQKVKSWMEGLMSSAVPGVVQTEISIDETEKCIVKYKVVKSGPALTIKMEGRHKDQDFNLDVDLVPCFTFFDDQWPKKGYKKNPSKTRKTFFVVPKSPSDDCPLYWRLSFQEQERELITSYTVLKPTIRLIKKMRDRYKHKIASYFIKTVFLWELETTDKNLWSKSLSFVLAMMLKRYSEYLEKKSIPYYWNSSNNLIGDLSDATAYGISNFLKNMVEHIDRICNSKSDLYGVVKYFLSNEEVDIEVFKQEVPLNKKLLKQIAVKSLETNVTVVLSEPTSATSSVSSSFEEITKDMVFEAQSQQTKGHQTLEALLLTLLSEQKRMYGMLEAAVIKIENCEAQIKELKCERDKQKIEDIIERKEILDVLNKIEKKIDNKQKSDSSSVDDILGLTTRFDNNLDL